MLVAAIFPAATFVSRTGVATPAPPRVIADFDGSSYDTTLSTEVCRPARFALTVLRLVDSDVTLSAVPSSDVDNDAMPLSAVASPVDALVDSDARSPAAPSSDVDSDANWPTLTASVALTPAATPVSVRAPWPPAKSTVRPGELAPTLIAPVEASCVTTPTPSDSMLVESEAMLVAVDVESEVMPVAVDVDNEVNWDMLTASVGLTPAARPLSNTPPVAFDIVNTLPFMPPVRK
ncbi:quinolinate phosphoribosyltransferase [Burkholderia pseudomallei]|nr:quinolinate phosphoribosyltransferase [Burkholderia pseudomallei]CAJ6867437.1 quinolinate phosphoribosyltransferase [Burkholderia pseudomallei]CAJ8404905.1 quinolinate phosphoribosyltransferase [Burkholderia pseudomallei]CAJ8665408.1 quinolinate phosphoribosyltransferase [Burkholderia pseudomallei]CAJ8912798.1 quinolinate phosphoribosyltransferase [Burkholderia pseudomallei]